MRRSAGAVRLFKQGERELAQEADGSVETQRTPVAH